MTHIFAGFYIYAIDDRLNEWLIFMSSRTECQSYWDDGRMITKCEMDPCL